MLRAACSRSATRSWASTSTGVTSSARGVAERLELPDEERATLLQAAALHDIGKAAIPDAILDKPGPLDERSGRSCASTP